MEVHDSQKMWGQCLKRRNRVLNTVALEGGTRWPKFQSALLLCVILGKMIL